MTRSANFALVALFLVAVGMRSQLSGLPPLLPQVESEFGASHSWSGFLLSLSFVTMGIGALAASTALRSIGSVRGITLMTLVIVLSGIARAAAPNALVVTAVGIPLGLATGLQTALLPVVTKERFRQFATSVYVIGISVGSGLALAAAAPIAAAIGGWRPAVLTFAAVTGLLTVPWLFVRRHSDTSETGVQRRYRWRHPAAAAAVPIAIFSLQSALFFGLSTWLPSAYIEHGWTATSAGLLASGLLVSSLVGSAAIAPLTRSPESTVRWLIVAALAAVVASFGLVVLPDAASAWAALAGASTGALLVLSLKLPLELYESAADVAALSGLMLAFGYWTGGAAPFVLGVLRDASGTFNTSFAALGVVSLMLVVISVRLTTRSRAT
jgi:CP family cyanate transporter-like MFS transporter